jgi:hypothetical protein
LMISKRFPRQPRVKSSSDNPIIMINERPPDDKPRRNLFRHRFLFPLLIIDSRTRCNLLFESGRMEIQVYGWSAYDGRFAAEREFQLQIRPFSRRRL